jgi:peptidyl-prolyl cis-trans isomerase NIMA-interacting 1
MRSVALAAVFALVGCAQSVHPRLGTGVPPPDWIEVEKAQLPGEDSAQAPVLDTGPTEIAARHILVAYRGSARAAATIVRSKPEALERAKQVEARLRAGEEFGALAAEYTDEPGGAERGGDLGRFTRDKMTKRFADAAFGLQPGQISEPVETQFGFHIIQRTE